MRIPPLSDEDAKAAVEAFKIAGGNKQKAADALGLSRSTFFDRLKIATKRGMLGPSEALPGFQIARISAGPNGTTVVQKPEAGETFALPDGHAIKGVSAFLDADGRVIGQWVKTKEGALDHDALISRIAAKYEAIDFRIPEIPAPKATHGEFLNFFGMGDMHWGLRVSGREVGMEDWDIARANVVYRDRFGRLMGRTPSARKCVLMVGGDVTHQNDRTNRTPGSGHLLDVDGSFDDSVEAAQEFILDAAMMAAQNHDEVELAFIKGNHDEESIIAVASFLRGVFRGNKRVSVTMPFRRAWVRQHGRTMLASVHGDMMKREQVPSFMAAEYPEIWGATKFRYGHTFHVHHRSKMQDEMGGVYIVTHQSPAPKDAWHFYMGFLSGRSFDVSMYHSQMGFQGNILEPILAEAA